MEPEQVLAEIEAEAPRQGWPIIGPGRGAILDEVLESHRPSTILEVGTNVGYSAIRMARHLRGNQRLTCVEISKDMAMKAGVNFEKAGLSERIVVIVGDALSVLPTLTTRFDMVFLDAVKGDYLCYLKAVEKLLHAGSVVVADNVKTFPSEVEPYLDYVRKSGAYASSYREGATAGGVERGDAVEISVRL